MQEKHPKYSQKAGPYNELDFFFFPDSSQLSLRPILLLLEEAVLLTWGGAGVPWVSLGSFQTGVRNSRCSSTPRC